MTARHYAAIAAVMFLACLECSAEAQPARVQKVSIRNGGGQSAGLHRQRPRPPEPLQSPATINGGDTGRRSDGAETVIEAQPARVEAGQVCAVKRALRNGHWSPKMCERVSEALNSTPDPVLFAAIAVNESDLRERAFVTRPRGVYDIGLMGVRCVTRTHEEDTQDLCLNGAARGLTFKKLLDPVVNIRAAVAILESHGGSLRGYSGSTRERGYGARIAVLVAAWGGELRIPKGAHGRKWARVRELARRIVGAVGKEPRS